MDKITAAGPESHSADLIGDNVAHLAGLFPEAIVDGKVDFDVLRQLLGDAIDDGEEKYGLNWHGKRLARRLALIPSTGTLRPCLDESVEWEATKNLVIEGDNLEILKLLQKSYAAKVKLIYIDPPYNTGNDFVYPDSFRDSIANYLELTGQADAEGKQLSTNAEASGRFHTDWLNMMYPRLRVARELLTDDGLLFVSIDEHEVANLRLLLDDIFGSESFIACAIWQKMDSPSRNSADRGISHYHEYVVIYGRDPAVAKVYPEGRASILDAYPLELEDGRLARRRQLRKNGKSARRADRPTLWFPLKAPDGTEVWPVAPEGWEGRWVLSQKTWDERTAAGMTEWIERDQGWVPYYIEVAPNEPTAPWSTLWTDVDQNRQAHAELTELLGPSPAFETPKPTSLLRQILQMATTSGDLVLDFFAGSGTTGHACFAESAETGIDRRFILIQLPELISEEGRTIADLTEERLRRARDHVRECYPDSVCDLGFRVFKLNSSNIAEWDPDASALAASLDEHIGHLKTDRSEADVLYEILLRLGLELTVPIESRTLARKNVHSVGAGALMVCLDTLIELAEVEPLGTGIVEWHQTLNPGGESTLVFRDDAFADDVAKTNLVETLVQHGFARKNIRSI